MYKDVLTTQQKDSNKICKWWKSTWKDYQYVSHQGNRNQNHNEISHYIHIYNQKMENNKSAKGTET